MRMARMLNTKRVYSRIVDAEAMQKATAFCMQNYIDFDYRDLSRVLSGTATEVEMVFQSKEDLDLVVAAIKPHEVPMSRTVGIGVVIKNGNTMLIGRRGPDSKRGAGMFALPGGMLDEKESIVDGALREVMEETGLKINFYQQYSNALPTFAITDHFPAERHLSVWLLGYYVNGTPVIKEPTKCLCWDWLEPADIKVIPGVLDEKSEQSYWLPYQMLRHQLGNLFENW